MGIYRYTLLILLFVAGLPLRAESVVCHPGEIAELVSDYTTITELQISGEADASDFFFIANNMPALRTLDLSNCTIAAYSGDAIAGLSTYVANTIPQGVFSASNISSVSLPTKGNITIGDCAFAGSALTTLTVPANVVIIGQGAFCNCPNLAEVTLSGAKSSGYIFSNCPGLKRVNFGSTTETGDSDYQGCTELSELTGTDNLKTIGANTFNGCEKIENFKFGNSLNSIGEAAFAHTGLATADMSSSSLESIGAWAFAGNSHLGNVLLPKMMKSIGDGAFFDCPALTNITLPEGIATLADYTFKGASKLESMAVPEGITNIGQYALKGADNIIDVTLPSSLESIGDNAMEGMSALKYIGATALTAVPALGKDVWNDVNQPAVRLDVNEDIANEFESAEQWQDFDINPINSSEAPIIAIDSISVRGRFDGYTLHIVATGVEINYIELFDTAGIQLMRYDAGGADSAAIDTSALSTSIFMVRCTLSNNTAASLKLARK